MLRSFHHHDGFTVRNDLFLEEECAGTLSEGTMHSGHLIPLFLNAIQHTPESIQIVFSPHTVPSEAWESDDHEYWHSENSTMLLFDLFDILDKYAPEGYYFGEHEGCGSDYGFWPLPREEDETYE